MKLYAFVSILSVTGIMFWNLENYFDYFAGHPGDTPGTAATNPSDADFSPAGTKHWTKARFTRKTEQIAKTILWAGSPDIIGVCEVENAFVLSRLCRCEILYKKNYGYVHHDSRDHRGIDVGLLYNKDNFTLLRHRAIPIVRTSEKGGRMRCDTLATRDILYVCLENRQGSAEQWHILVNHHPSKVGGGDKSDSRALAMATLAGAVDSLHHSGVTINIVAMGDFNDTPDAEAFSLVEGLLVNLGKELCGGQDSGFKSHGTSAEGTIRYNGRWELIDNFLVSPDVAAKKKMTVIRPPFLLERDRKHPGEKPFRTYSGPRYLGGVSDHLPVILLD